MNTSNTPKKPKHPRWIAFKEIVQEVHKGGWVTAADLETRTKQKHSTIRHDLKLGVHIGIFKQTHMKGPYAWIDYEDDEEQARDLARNMYLVYVSHLDEFVKSGDIALAPPKITEYLNTAVIPGLALKLGRSPSDEYVAKKAYKAFHDILDHPEKHFSPQLCKEIKQMEKSAFDLMAKISQRKNAQA